MLIDPTGVLKATSWKGPAVPGLARGIQPKSPPSLDDLHSEYFSASCTKVQLLCIGCVRYNFGLEEGW